MKQFLLNVAMAIVLAGLMLWTSACNDDDKPDPKNQIVKTWSVGSTGFVKQDGVDVTSEYTGLTISIKNDGTYSTTNAAKLFYPTGAWAWKGPGITTFTIDGDFDINVTELSATTLHINFNMDVDHVNPDGRTSAVVGSYEIKLEGN